MLEEFVRSDDIVVQRCMVAGIDFDSSQLDETANELREDAIVKAKAHDDDYIGHRIQIQLGESSGPFQPLDTKTNPEINIGNL